MAMTRPHTEQLADIARQLGLNLSKQDFDEYLVEMQSSFDAYELVDELVQEAEPVRYPRQRGYRPEGVENRFGAWACKSEVRGAEAGALSGKTVVLKDNVALAGVPMVNGSSTLRNFVPSSDATVVTRILEAGGTILGKATCESFCMSGGSHTSEPGPVHNPWRHGFSAGGSSSGSAALVAAGEVDMAIGGDQGGSIRIPSSYCGIYGMKPTWGLVPYTGIMPIEATIDHAGPMTATVADNALLLNVIAGGDGLDPRQRAHDLEDYGRLLGQGLDGLKIGVLAEGLAANGIQSGVVEKVRSGAGRLAVLGASMKEISIPEHVTAVSLWTVVGVEGLTTQMMMGNGMGFNWKGRYDVGLIDEHASWRENADALSAPLKLAMLTGQWGITQHRGRYYAKAQNLARMIKAAYDRAFETVDLILMPTLPRIASALPPTDAPLSEIIKRASELNVNTCPFDLTGHPAMSIPCGLLDGLPVGMMLVGRDYAEATIYRAAAAFEAAGDWRQF